MKWAIIGIVAAVVALISIPIYFISTAKPSASGMRQSLPSQNTGDWKDLGWITDGVTGSAWVMKRTDPDNGATIYVMMGSNRGAMFVLPKADRQPAER
jgi:hypothetical protein